MLAAAQRGCLGARAGPRCWRSWGRALAPGTREHLLSPGLLWRAGPGRHGLTFHRRVVGQSSGEWGASHARHVA